MKETILTMNMPVYLDLSMLEISKIVMYQFWYDYLEPKHEEKAKLGFMDTDSFIVYIRAEEIYVDIAKDAESIFDT